MNLPYLGTSTCQVISDCSCSISCLTSFPELSLYVVTHVHALKRIEFVNTCTPVQFLVSGSNDNEIYFQILCQGRVRPHLFQCWE